MSIIDVNKGIEDVGKIVDEAYTTDEESGVEATKRLISDNGSGSWIPKAIRPFLSVYFSLLYGYLAIKGIESGAVSLESIIFSTAGVVGAIVAFYFTGRSKLKVIEMQSKAAIRITELKTKANIKQTKKELRQNRRQQRRNK